MRRLQLLRIGIEDADYLIDYSMGFVHTWAEVGEPYWHTEASAQQPFRAIFSLSAKAVSTC